MALLLANQVKIITASGGGTLTPQPGQSIRVRDIHCVPSSSDTYLTLLIGGATVGLYRVKGYAGNHQPFPCIKTTQVYERITGGLMRFLAALGLDMSIPIADGESLTVKRYAETGNVCLIYDVFDAADVKPTDPNGSESLVRRYVHPITNTAAITSTPVTLATSLIWTGGDQWPVNGLGVPDKTTFKLIGLIGAPSARGNASANKGYSTYLQLLKRNDQLFDIDRNGLPFKGNSAATADTEDYTSLGSLIGPLTAESPAPPLIFPSPLVFATGDTLTVQVVLAAAASGGIVPRGSTWA